MRARRAEARAPHGSDFAARAGGSGVTRGRHDERGANTPWYLTSGILRRRNQSREPGHEPIGLHDAVGASSPRAVFSILVSLAVGHRHTVLLWSSVTSSAAVLGHRDADRATHTSPVLVTKPVVKSS